MTGMPGYSPERASVSIQLSYLIAQGVDRIIDSSFVSILTGFTRVGGFGLGEALNVCLKAWILGTVSAKVLQGIFNIIPQAKTGLFQKLRDRLIDELVLRAVEVVTDLIQSILQIGLETNRRGFGSFGIHGLVEPFDQFDALPGGFLLRNFFMPPKWL
jgi:hypothetical protein